MKKIALYSCNFGNYRNELDKGIDKNIEIDKHIDYYFFTDHMKLTSKKWKIIHYPLVEGNKIMDTYRWTSKQVKFILPDILKKYKIIIWLDSKIIFRSKVVAFKGEPIINLFKKTTYHILNLKHLYGRTMAHEEIKLTIEKGMEDKQNGLKFLEEIKDIKYKTQLLDSCCFVRKTDTKTNHLFKFMYELLNEKKLKRDQNIYDHAIYLYNYPTNQIGYFKRIRDFYKNKKINLI
jgi:hypothetical protein